jgi:hypothetical protein
MPFVHITWLPKACRTAKVRKEIADVVIKAMTAHPTADIAKENLVVRFSESVDGFPLPKGHSMNPDLQGAYSSTITHRSITAVAFIFSASLTRICL